jgi:hypothetical protein
MGVTVCRAVDVDVDEPRHATRVIKAQSRFLVRLSDRGVGRLLAGSEVTARLHPAPETPVDVENCPPWSHHHGRTGQMHRTGLLVEGIVERVEILEDALSGFSLPVIVRHVTN